MKRKASSIVTGGVPLVSRGMRPSRRSAPGLTPGRRSGAWAAPWRDGTDGRRRRAEPPGAPAPNGLLLEVVRRVVNIAMSAPDVSSV